MRIGTDRSAQPSPTQYCSYASLWLLWINSKTKVQSVPATWIWPMNPQQQQRLAHAINELRPDWPISSLSTFIERHLGKRTYRDAAVALVWVAVDTKPDGTPASDKPGRVLEHGPWNRAVLVDDPSAMATVAPKRHEQCRDCGRSLDGCLCDHGPTPYGSKPDRGDPKSGAKACRDALNQAANR